MAAKGILMIPVREVWEVYDVCPGKTINETHHRSNLHIGIFGNRGSAVRLRFFHTATHAAAAATNAAANVAATDRAASDGGADAAAKGFAE